MEVTLRMIVAFALLGIMALLAGSIAQDQTQSADSTLDSQVTSAKCDLWEVQRSESSDGCNRARYLYEKNCGSGSVSSKCQTKYGD
ncbi:hypothetical protein [Candidatus Nanohalococcus occultus]|uniref:Uncharacterized protein n=1 Tax=Candidatus Nanohalococcus occultus TaxID=2978047 RepID=A0ABY8CJ21_9ARCH|nr:hypothetical protein SVXNc_1003 [Candidatus Nanohaloarchaeota archaeon SVXNc]